jgi:hypothetical protein
MSTPQIEDQKIVEEKPPFFSSWKQLYLMVFSFLVLQIVLYYLFTISFS